MRFQEKRHRRETVPANSLKRNDYPVIKQNFRLLTNKSREFYLDFLANSRFWDTETELSELSKIGTYMLIF